jgi:hypothetical protein
VRGVSEMLIGEMNWLINNLMISAKDITIIRCILIDI